MLPSSLALQAVSAATAEMFAVHTIGPALVLRHFLPLLSRDGRAVPVALSARVGCIGDNKLGVIASLAAEDSGEFLNPPGQPVPG